MYFFGQPQRPQRPKLPSFGPYEAASTPPSPSATGSGGILASCRALQSLLGGPVQALRSTTREDVAASQASFAIPGQGLQSPPAIITLPRGANKRCRNEYEEDLASDTEDTHTAAADRDVYQTPKRQRFASNDLPLGLNASDFDSLITPNLPQEHMDDVQPSNHSEDTVMSTYPAEPLQSCTQHWTRTNDEQFQGTPKEDRRLIDAVWSRLNLTSRDWNDCAKEVSKNKVSLGQRWKMIAGR